MEGPVHTSDGNFKRDVLDSKIPVLVDFWAEWCGPCRMMEPVLEDLAKEYAGKFKIAKLNVDENEQVTQDYHVKGMPTFLFFKDGQVVKEILGAVSKGRLAGDFEEILG